MTATIIETGKLVQVVGYSLLTGVGIAIVFSLGVSSAAGLLDAMRVRRSGGVALWGALATLCALITVAVIVLGIVVLSTK